MPIYEYRCENDHNFEVMKRISDDPVVACELCEAPVRRVFHPIAVHFKGSGFYNTDYGTRKRSREKESAEGSKGEGAEPSKGEGAEPSKGEGAKASKTDSSSSNSDSGSSKSDSGSAKKAETKAAAAD